MKQRDKFFVVESIYIYIYIIVKIPFKRRRRRKIFVSKNLDIIEGNRYGSHVENARKDSPARFSYSKGYLGDMEARFPWREGKEGGGQFSQR